MTPPAAPPLWELRLSDFLGSVTADLYALGSERGLWLSRTIRSGLIVSFSLGEDSIRRCRIASENRPGTAAGWSRFHESVEVTAQHLGVSHWRTVAPSLAAGEVYRGAIVEFSEPGVTG